MKPIKPSKKYLFRKSEKAQTKLIRNKYYDLYKRKYFSVKLITFDDEYPEGRNVTRATDVRFPFQSITYHLLKNPLLPRVVGPWNSLPRRCSSENFNLILRCSDLFIL